jgi:malate dehydrogenase
VRGAGGEIVNLMKTSAFYSPATARDPHGRGRICSTSRRSCLRGAARGEYGVDGFYVGVPVQIGGRASRR